MKVLLLSLKSQCTRTQETSLTQLKLSIVCHMDRPPLIATVDSRVCPWWWSAELNLRYFVYALSTDEHFNSVQFSRSFGPDTCNLMDCSKPGFLVHHQLPELTHTQVLRVSDAIQQFHPLLYPSSAFNLSQHQIFSNESVLRIRWPKYWSFSFSISSPSEYSGLISFRMD